MSAATRPTIKAATEMMRAARATRIRWHDDPFKAEVPSTDGTYAHDVVYDNAGALLCSTCKYKHGNEVCWAVHEVEKRLPGHVAAVVARVKPELEPVPEIPAIGSQSWREAFADAQRERKS